MGLTKEGGVVGRVIGCRPPRPKGSVWLGGGTPMKDRVPAAAAGHDDGRRLVGFGDDERGGFGFAAVEDARPLQVLLFQVAQNGRCI